MHPALREIESLLARHVPFEHIEAEIEDMDLSADQKSALYLLAWAETDRRQRRKAVEELLRGEAHLLW